MAGLTPQEAWTRIVKAERRKERDAAAKMWRDMRGANPAIARLVYTRAVRAYRSAINDYVFGDTGNEKGGLADLLR